MGIPSPFISVRARILSITALVALVAATLTVAAVTTTSASADTAPVDSSTPTTVTADALATAQINGVAWSQVIIGNTVYVGGSFSTARPAGSAAGVNTVSRTNLLSYNLTTGALLPWAPVLNAQVRSLAASPDGTRLYVGGDFTTINGVAKSHIAAFDVASGNLASAFTASANGEVHAVSATNSTVFFGGPFTSAKGVARSGAAAASASTGDTTGWAPVIAGTPANGTTAAVAGYIYAITVSPDGSKVVVGGNFATVNGSSNPGYGLAATDASTGALLPWNVNNTVRDAGKNSAIFSLTSDADSVYGTGYVFGAGGNLEGTFRAGWASGDTTWIEDCHGDTYSVAATTDVIYVASHEHFCGNIDAFPETTVRSFHRATAFTKVPTGTITTDTTGYYNFAGQTRPTQLNWYPSINTGTYTGQNQGAWSVAANSQYAVYGGEFTTVNGVSQQGLVRFAVSSIAPNKSGPQLVGNQFVPTVDSPAAGTVRVSWNSNYDMDNTNLTYQVIRNNATATPVYTTSANLTFWQRQNMIFVDTGLTPGQTYTYKIRAIDPSGNVGLGSNVSVTVSATGTLSSYDSAVLAAQPTSYFKLGEATGSTTGVDSAGTDSTTIGSGVTLGTTGPIAGDATTAATFDGTSNGTVASANAQYGPQTFTIETWFKTTSTSGGKIVGFGNTNSGLSGSYDRHVYMTSNGQVVFGVYNGNINTIRGSKAYNDGNWHYVVASLGSTGMQLYVDGKRVGSNPDTVNAQSYSGYWRIGGDSAWEGNNFFAGSIDDVAIYPAVLTAAQITSHYQASGRTVSTVPAPTDSYGAAVYAQDPDIYWRLDEAAGTVANDSGPESNPGVYSGGYTQGASGALSGTTDTAVQFGTNGVVASATSISNPTTYTTQVWFKTTTTHGGKLTGFGSSQSGTSDHYDRHVYMQNNGQLVFGTYTGQLNTATSPNSYNDGKWHQVTATQSSAGMKLYVDGALVATNSQTGAENYSGYWRVGGDNTWGSDSQWFDGTLDEFAVYSTALPASTVANLYSLGAPANTAPTASFSSSTNVLSVSTDATASTDTDGTVASYSWSWGDGSATSTGATATHTYAASGSYPVTLTVTDNGGATGTTTKNVIVTAPNVAPTASFTATPTNLSVAVDASASTDTDGSVVGYNWNFGDGTTATGVTTSHSYASAGTYTVTLTVSDDGGLTSTSTKSVTVTAPAPVNHAPTAAFSATVSNLSVAFDGTGSVDSDGTIASYSWNFGDGTSGTGATPTHVYPSGGSFPVVLTVSDNGGLTATVTHSVLAVAPPAPNVAPTASYTSTVTNLSVAFDGTASNDTDGTIQTYAWDYGDGSTGSGPTSSHTYATAGTYTAKLTVTDNGGLTGSVSKSVVTVAAPVASQSTLAVDAFTRTSPSGWGAATTGGAWSATGTNYTVNNGIGSMSATAGATRRNTLTAVSTTDFDGVVQVSIDKAATGGGVYAGVVGRQVGSSYYQVRTRFLAGGTVALQAMNGSSTLITNVAVPGITYTAGTQLQMRVQITGTSPTTIRAKVWAVGGTEPTTWTLSTTDSTAALQTAGYIGLESYASGSITNAPVTVSYDNLNVTTSAGAPVPPANVAPTAAFTSSVSNLVASVDGTSSTDSDGTVASYAWNFGDGSVGTGATLSHTYAAAGTYTVSLTVTDNAGATNTVTKTVVATAPPVAPGATLASDTFTRTIPNGWGTADTGGAWTTTVNTNYFVSNGSAGFLAAVGTTRRAVLTSVNSSSTDVTAQVTSDKVATGGGFYAGVVGRQVGTSYYQARVRFVAGGTIGLQIMNGSSTVLANTTVAGLTYQPGQQLQVRVQTTGTNPTTIRARVWAVGTTEPTTWNLSTTDATAALQAAGYVGAESYLSGSATNGPVTISYDNLTATILP